MKNKKNIILKVRIVIISGKEEEVVRGKGTREGFLECWHYSRSSCPMNLFHNHGIEVLSFSLIDPT